MTLELRLNASNTFSGNKLTLFGWICEFWHVAISTKRSGCAPQLSSLYGIQVRSYKKTQRAIFLEYCTRIAKLRTFTWDSFTVACTTMFRTKCFQNCSKIYAVRVAQSPSSGSATTRNFACAFQVTLRRMLRSTTSTSSRLFMNKI